MKNRIDNKKKRAYNKAINKNKPQDKSKDALRGGRKYKRQRQYRR